jgi:hypothetical protein
MGETSNYKILVQSEMRALKIDLIRQWFSNHAEHCGALIPPWPHNGLCKWPLPPTLMAASTPEIYWLLQLAEEG